MSDRDLRLCTGTTFAVFQSEGWTPCSKHSENRWARGVAKTALHSFRTLAGTPSGPVALAGSSWPRRRLTVDGRKRIRQSVEEHREGNRGMSVALKSPSSRQHFLAKKRPKHSAIYQILFSFSTDKDRRTDSRIRRKNTAQPRRESNPRSCEF